MFLTAYSLVILLLPLLFGYTLTVYLTRTKPLPLYFSLAVGYGIGTGMLAQWMLVLAVLKIPLTSGWINLPILILTFTFTGLLKSQGIPLCPLSLKSIRLPPHPDPLICLMIGYIGLNVAYVFWRAFHVPISSWDAFSVYTFQAKIIFIERSLQYHPNFPHFTYPFHTPFLQAWTAITTGVWDEQTIKYFFPFYFLSYLIIQYTFLRTCVCARWALFSLVLLASSNFYVYHSTIAYRDAIMLFYNGACAILLIMWVRSKHHPLLVLISLMCGFMTFNKLDGIGYLLIYAGLGGLMLFLHRDFSIKEKLYGWGRLSIPGLAMFLFYQIYLVLRVIPQTLLHASEGRDITLFKLNFQMPLEHLEKVWVIAERLLQNLFLTNNWNIIWGLLIASLFTIRSSQHKIETRLCLMILALCFGMSYAGYVLTQHYYWAAETDTVVSRGILHLLPLASLLIVFLNAPDSKDSPRSKHNFDLNS